MAIKGIPAFTMKWNLYKCCFLFFHILIRYIFQGKQLEKYKQDIHRFISVDSELKAHSRAWATMMKSPLEWFIVKDSRINLTLSEQIAMYDIIQNVPRDWTVLQLNMKHRYFSKHYESLSIDWVHWLPHHTGHNLYAIKKEHAMRMQIHAKNRSGWSTNLEEFMFTQKHSYTLTYSKRKIHPMNSSLMIITVNKVSDLTHIKASIKQFETECQQINRFYKSPPRWVVTFVYGNAKHKGELTNMRGGFVCQNVEFHIHFQRGIFNKWLYVIPHISKMSDYDYVLYKDFDQLLSGFDWPTFMEPKSTIRSAVRESVKDSLSTYKGSKRAWFQVNDAAWWRSYEYEKWSSLKCVERPFLEMYFVLFNGAFAKWFFSLIFGDQKFIHDVSDWGPDIMWCAAAIEWSATTPSCLLAPVTTYHADERQISRHGGDYKERMVPVKIWEKYLPHWTNYSSRWREKWGGNTQWTYNNSF
tara:strand:+ start:8084 stop:9493 length:1410 start_codon:yes stop_codon:yes gene_type:complete